MFGGIPQKKDQAAPNKMSQAFLIFYRLKEWLNHLIYNDHVQMHLW